jgi:hypothetical protein
MRWCASIPTIAALLAARPAAAEPLAEVSARIGAGLAAGGGAGRSTLRVRGRHVRRRVRDQRRAVRLGLRRPVLETYDAPASGSRAACVRSGIAVGPLGARSLVRPYTLHGALVGASWCWPAASLRGCVDVEADLYVAGTDLPKKTAIAQLVVAIGVSFDVW